jgi:uncharacterized protein YndB with AHSA1/START domain
MSYNWSAPESLRVTNPPAMLKWILGCLGLIVVVVACALWFGYRKLQTFADLPPVATVTIAAPPSRVFASLASADSMTTWMTQGTQVTSPRHGLLMPGDTVMIVGTVKDTLHKRAMWIVTSVVPDKLFAIEMRNEGTGAVGISRRDSLVAVGGSTLVASWFAMDSLRTMKREKGAAGAVIDMTGKLVLSALRLEANGELKRLKARIEGSAAPDTVAKPPNT